MNIPNGISSRLAAATLSVLVSMSAFAQTDEERRAEEESAAQKTKQAQAVSKEVYDRITVAQAEIEAENYSSAMSILQGLLGKKGLTEYERQNVLNYIGFVQYSTEDVKGAIRTYKEMLLIPSIEPQIRKQTVYTLAQLSTMEEDYAGALKLMDEWFVLETNPPPEAYILYANNLYQLNRYKDMIRPIEAAMSVAEARQTPVKEDWYVLLNFAYFQQENYTKVRDIQKILLVNWPKKRYWFSLAGAYTELNEENNLINAYAAAHTQGLFEKESELTTMAQLFMQAEVPYKAGKLLEEEMVKGRVAKDAKNYRLLSQAWTLAMEDEKAIPALKEAARLSDEGELDLRLANSYLNVGKYSECVSAIRAGIRKGGIKSPDNAQISLGMCQYNLKQYQDAIAAFREASKSDRSRRVANQWIAVIQSDVDRNEQIQLAEAAARKQQEALSRRRQAVDRL